MHRTFLTCIVTLALVAGCGPGEEDSNATNNPDNVQTTGGTCADGEFDALQPMTDYPMMPLYFEYPEGWTVSDETNDFAYAAAISKRTSANAPGYIQLVFNLRKGPGPDPESARTGFLAEGRELLRTIDFGGEEVEVYTLSEGDSVLLVDAAFVFPSGEDFFYAEFNANAPVDECLEERRALRTAVLDSLAPAD